MIETKEAGKCPYCGSEDIDYGTMYPEDDNTVSYKCTCKECNQSFTEWYLLQYCETVGYGKRHITEDN
jgi:Zn finger protein HypA/HybF involved in hydrogenase expression